MTLPVMPSLPPSGDTTWYDYATDLHDLVSAIRDGYESTLHAVLWDGTSYAARPTGVAAGYAVYVGPTEPTTWLVDDIWLVS